MSSEFVKMIADLNERRLLRTMQSLVASKTSCAIFFAPNVPDNARRIADFLRNGGINLNCIVVLTEADKKFFQPAADERLISVEEFPALPDKPQVVFIVQSFFAEMFMDYFARFGTKMITSTNVTVAENTYDNFMRHLPELYDVHEMLDDESKKVFRAAILSKVTWVLNNFRFAAEPQYFLNGFLPTEGDIAIDGGAYEGATAADFVRQGAEVFAFEMDATNFQKCLPIAERFGFTVENLGLSNQIGTARYSGGGVGSHKLANNAGLGIIGHFIDLDTYVAQKNLPRVDYIKLDVEGAELDVLHGAAKTIARWKPKMAISAYHKTEDLWTLATYIKSLRDDYEFKFRHYRIDCTNYLFTDEERAVCRIFELGYLCPSECEMVLYCR